MSDLYAQFESTAREAQELPARPDNQTLLRLYALYKQAKFGDVSGDRPGLSDLVDRFKYDARAKLAGTSKEDAMQSYIELVKFLNNPSGSTAGKEHAP